MNTPGSPAQKGRTSSATARTSLQTCHWRKSGIRSAHPPGPETGIRSQSSGMTINKTCYFGQIKSIPHADSHDRNRMLLPDAGTGASAQEQGGDPSLHERIIQGIPPGRTRLVAARLPGSSPGNPLPSGPVNTGCSRSGTAGPSHRDHVFPPEPAGHVVFCLMKSPVLRGQICHRHWPGAGDRGHDVQRRVRRHHGAVHRAHHHSWRHCRVSVRLGPAPRPGEN